MVVPSSGYHRLQWHRLYRRANEHRSMDTGVFHRLLGGDSHDQVCQAESIWNLFDCISFALFSNTGFSKFSGFFGNRKLRCDDSCRPGSLKCVNRRQIVKGCHWFVTDKSPHWPVLTLSAGVLSNGHCNGYCEYRTRAFLEKSLSWNSLEILANIYRSSKFERALWRRRTVVNLDKEWH